MNQKLLSIAFALTFMAVLTMGYTQLQGQAADTPAKVAYVDIKILLKDLDEKAAIQADLNVMKEKVQREDQERKTEITALQEDLKISKKGTDNFNNLMEKLEIKVMEYEAWGKLQQLRVAREEVIRTKKIYKKMIDTIAAVANKRGFDFVLQKDGIDDVDNFRVQNNQQLLGLIGGHKVLFAAGSRDITNEVTQQMNNDFNTSKK